MRNRISWQTAAAVALAFAWGCGSSAGGNANPKSGDGGTTTAEGGTSGSDSSPAPDSGGAGEAGTGGGSNVTPVVVNAGPIAASSVDVPFINVTLCVPGTTQCQTLEYVSVDTGSTGLRVIASELSSSLALPTATATTGQPLAECYTFDDGYVWGSVRLADVRIAGELAGKIPIQVIGDPTVPSVPTDCSNTGSAENTVAAFGSYGLIGINQIVADCGDYCSDTVEVGTGAYYSCTGSACDAVAVADANQVPNPIAFFAKDNNGSVLQFPAIAASGAATLSGSLIFGIGTATNNALGNAQVLTVDSSGNFTTVYKGQTLSQSFLDSGTNSLSFNDNSIAECSSQELSGFYCPTSTLSLSAQNIGISGVTSDVSFSVESAQTLFDNESDSVFDDLGTTGSAQMFDWGFPFFVGRSVYVALQGAATPGGEGPYFAY